jgi:hypothetical protein
MKKEEILANCIDEILSGKSTIEDCVNRYPAFGKELRSLLEIAVSLKPVEVIPSPEFKERVKLHLFDEERPSSVKVSGRNFWSWLEPTPVKVAVSVFLGVLIFAAAGSGVVYAAQSSTPGTPLYPVKTGVENVQLAITTSPVAKARLYLELAQRRINEMAQEAKQNQNINPQTVETVTQQFNKALNKLSIASNLTAINNTLSYMSVATVNEQVELQQVITNASPKSQPGLEQIESETARANTIAQVAYANHDLLKQPLSVTDQQLDAGQFSIQGTLSSIQENNWEVGGTNIDNVIYSGKVPAIGSQVKLTGLVKNNNTYITSITVTKNSTAPTEVEGQFEGTNQNGTANVSGISVNINNNGNAQLKPGESVQLQGDTTNSKLNVTSQQSSGTKTTTLNGVLSDVNLVTGIITVQLAGSHVKVDISNALIQNYAGTTTLKIADLKLLIGHEIRIEGLSKNGDQLSATTVQIRAND